MTNITFQRTNQRAFGTYPLQGRIATEALRTALEVGYRAIDTAQMYGNEAAVGEAIATAAVPRDELCVLAKVHPDHFTEKTFLPSVERSLQALQVEFVDILLLHWPPADGEIAPSLRLLQEALDSGLTRHIGVSNYTSRMMRDAVSIVDAPLVTNQVEFHPLLNQDVLLAAATETGIPLSSYSSVARGEVFKYPLFGELGAIYGKSAAQVALRWILQKGVAINTMSTKPENMRANFEIMDFTLSSIDMARIEALTRTGHRVVTRSAVPWAPEWD